MKKLIIASLLLTTLISFPTLAQSKVAHVNTQEIFVLMPGAQAAEKELSEMRKAFEEEFAVYQKEREGKQTALIKAQQSGNSGTVETLQKDLQQFLNTVREREVAIQQELQQKEFDLLQPVNEELLKAIESVAESMDLEYVFQNPTNGLLVARGSDITENVKEKLGL